MSWNEAQEAEILALAKRAWAGSSPWFLNYVPDRDAAQHSLQEDADLWHNGGPGGTIATIHGCTVEDSAPAHYIERAVNLLPEAIREIQRLRALVVATATPAPAPPVKAPAVHFCGVAVGDRAGHFPRSWPANAPPSPWCVLHDGACSSWPLHDRHPDRDGPGPRVDRDRAIRHARWRSQEGDRAEPEGEFVHLICEGWTMLAAWDRSADPRGGCTATFALQGEFEPAVALRIARETYPGLLARIEEHVGRAVTVRAWDG